MSVGLLATAQTERMVTGGRWVKVIGFRITAGHNQGVILATA
jgi:hypothetical protein